MGPRSESLSDPNASGLTVVQLPAPDHRGQP